MKYNNQLDKKIIAASGEMKASLVLKNAKVVNVFTEEIEQLDIAIEEGYIVGLGQYEGETEIDLTGYTVCPGLLDGHIHLESSMVSPKEFQKAVMPHGTTAVITDPHEIANVAGVDGIRYMLEETEKLNLDVFFMLPSCVPATGLDEAGANLGAKELRPLYEEERVLGLAELMNSYGTIRADQDILEKVKDAHTFGKMIDGHGPSLQGKALNAYVMAGVKSDHECSYIAEAKEKISRGQWVMLREGTAAKNLDALMPLFDAPYYNRTILVTDDKHPGDLIQYGHMDYIIREAIKKGADPIRAIKMATMNTASYFGLRTHGAIAPGYLADLVVVSDLEQFNVVEVYKEGKLVAKNGEFTGKVECSPQSETTIEDPFAIKNNHKDNISPQYKAILDSCNMDEVTVESLTLHGEGELQRVIKLAPYSLITSENVVEWTENDGYAPGVDIKKDVIKMAVVERHHNTGHVGIGFIGGYGLTKGAVASSVAHDSHNLIIAGTNDADMVIAANCVRNNKGGLAVVVDGKVISQLPLPIGGLMTNESVDKVEETLKQMKSELRMLGVPEEVDPFMTLAFASLPVIPQLRLNTFGLIDVEKQKVIPVRFSK